MKQFEIELIDPQVKQLFTVGVGFIEILKPIEIWKKLPPHLDHRILFRDHTRRDHKIIMHEIYLHLIEQFKYFLKEESESFYIDPKSFYDIPIKVGDRSMIKVLYYSKIEEN